MGLDKSDVSFETKESHHDDETAYWAQAPVDEKIWMITYLRECFYGSEATTGRLQRFFEFSKQK